MAQIVGIDREQMTEADGNDIEHAAIEIKILEAEEALVPEAARIVGDDQFAVVMLHSFIVGDRIALVGQQRDEHERRQEHDGGDIMGLEARDPSYRVSQGQSSFRNAGNVSPGWHQLGHMFSGPGLIGRRICANP
jgi:hypothetical protein